MEAKFLLRFPGVLDPSPQLSLEFFRQVVVTVAILEYRSHLFALSPGGDVM